MNKKEKSKKFKQELSELFIIFFYFLFYLSFFSEFETENNLKFRSKQITFSKHLNNYSNKFQITMKQLIHTYQQLKSEIENENSYFSNQTNQIQEKYDQLQNHTEIIYENQMIETVLISFFFQNNFFLCSFLAFTYSKYSN